MSDSSMPPLEASVCPACGHPNGLETPACAQCGAALPWAEYMAAVTAVPPPAHEQHKTAFHEAGIGMALFGLDAQMWECNQALCDFLGYTAQELLALPVKDFSHPGDYELDLDYVRRLFAGEFNSYQMEKRYLHRDGHYVWGLLHVTLVYNDLGRPHFAITQIQDITERKAAEAAQAQLTQRLRAERQRITDIVQAVPGVVWEAWGEPDSDAQRIDFVSAYVETMLGYTVEEWLATPNFWLTIVHPGDREHAAATASEQYSAGGGVNRFRWVAKDGRVLDVEGMSSVVRDEAGVPLGMRGVTVDVSERNRLLASERRAREEAEHASRTKDEFLATVSHELRTPLNAIMGWAHVLRSDPSGAEVPRGLEVIERNARAQAQLIEDLLDMSRIISGQLRLDVQRIAPGTFIEAAVLAVQPAAQAKAIALETRLDPALKSIAGDATRLQQVVWNLLSNAIKFTPCGGRVEVLLTRDDANVEISVSDSGQGIEPEFLPHVFDRFRQADASTTRRHSGLGLGLGIVRQLVELHGGTVRAASEGAGLGATFTVTLPVTADLAPEAERAATMEADSHTIDSDLDRAAGASEVTRPTLAGVDVLVVDDDPDTRSLVKWLLEQGGAAVRSAGSAAEAMLLLRERRPTVIVSDIAMPHEDGYALIRRIRALPDANLNVVPAVALTALARVEDRTRALLEGYDQHLAKPVDPAELLVVVASAAGLTPSGVGLTRRRGSG